MSRQSFIDKYGPWALITGASSGIGAEFARQIARRGIDVVLVARRGPKLDALAREIEADTGVATRSLPADLGSSSEVSDLAGAVAGLDIGLLINNAGREDSGPFFEADIAATLSTVDLNVKAPLLLTHLIAGPMVARRRGGIVFMSSVVAFQGVPLIASYAATKAFDLIFAEGLGAELRGHGIDTLAVAPGFTRTQLSPHLDFSGLPIRPLEPRAVVETSLRALGRRRLVIPGLMNRALYLLGKYAQPRWLTTWAFGRVFRHVLRRTLSGDVESKTLLPER